MNKEDYSDLNYVLSKINELDHDSDVIVVSEKYENLKYVVTALINVLAIKNNFIVKSNLSDNLSIKSNNIKFYNEKGVLCNLTFKSEAQGRRAFQAISLDLAVCLLKNKEKLDDGIYYEILFSLIRNQGAIYEKSKNGLYVRPEFNHLI